MWLVAGDLRWLVTSHWSLAIAGHRHDDAGVAVVREEDRGRVFILDFEAKVHLRVEDFEKVADENVVERDDDLLPVVADRHLDARLAVFLRGGFERERAFRKGEIDAAAVLAGDDGGLAMGG